MLTALVIGMAVFVAMEIVTSPIYIVVRRRFDHEHRNPFFNIEAVKGILERLVLLIGLLLSFPQILIVFGALKIGNRLHAEENTDKAKNYFLIGNLLSRLFVFLDYAIIRLIFQ